MSATQPRIAIIGGGLGGLSLLLTLHRRGVPATVYERDASFSVRAHLGGSLDLGWRSGQRALRENGLEDEFVKNSRADGEEMRLYDASGELIFHIGEDGKVGDVVRKTDDIRPEIDRTVLRKILLDACPVDAIKWDHAFVSARPLAGGQHEVTFANGTTIVCDLLVGADGASSRLRPLLSPAQPYYTGVMGVEVSLAPDIVTSEELREVVENIGKGSMGAAQDNKQLSCQLNGSGRIRTYVFFRGPEDWALPADVAGVRRVLLEMFQGWAPWMLKPIEYCDPEAIYHRAMYTLPPGHKWTHVDGVTLAGDAAHLMTPFAGAGANLAMLDGLELGIAIADAMKNGKGEMEEAIKTFEEQMCAMAGRVSAKALVTLDAFINPNSPQSILDRFKQIMSEGGPREG